MKLQDNPFYLLKLSCNANRKDIVSAVEEMSFVFDSVICSNAQNELINLNKRLSAELGWFIDLGSEDINNIREAIQNGEEISTDGLYSLSKLNATLYNFSLTSDEDPFEIGYAILNIDDQYSNLDVDEIVSLINTNRTNAKLALVQDQEVSDEINHKRDDIRQAITDRLSHLDQDSYVELVTMIAEKCIADDVYEDGVILSDVVDQYEIRMQSQIDENTEAIQSHIECIQQLTNDNDIGENIILLLTRVEKWDKMAQPIQLKSQASGMPHEISERIGFQLRELAVYLHNMKGKTNEALVLVDAMKEVFAELGNLSDLFEKDSDVLNDLLQRDKKTKDILVEMEALQKMSESVKTIPSSNNVNSFIDRVRKLDARLKQIDLDTETKTKVRENLCYLARGTAIELHNTKHQTACALSIAKALVVEFYDMPALRSKLNEDSTALSQQLLLANQANTYPDRSYGNSSNSKSGNYGCLVPIIIAVVIGIIVLASSSGGASSTKTSSSSIYKPSNGYSTGTANSTEVRFSSSAVSGDRVYMDIVSIFPEIGIYVQGNSNYSYLVCKCKTSSGSIVWVYMTVSEYKNNFDFDASTSISNQYAEEVTFSSSKRIHGTAKNAESIMSGLSSDTGIMVIDFSSLN